MIVCSTAAARTLAAWSLVCQTTVALSPRDASRDVKLVGRSPVEGAMAIEATNAIALMVTVVPGESPSDE